MLRDRTSAGCGLLVALMLTGCATGRGATTKAEAPSASTEGGLGSAPPTRPQPWERSEPPAPLPRVARVEPQSHRVTLGNGLTVVVVEHHARPLVSLRLYLPSGAASDPADRAGATFFAVSALVNTFDRKDVDGDRVDPSEKSARRLVLETGATLRFDVGADSAWVGIDGFAVDTTQYVERLFRVLREARHGEDSFAALAQQVADSMEELELTDAHAIEQLLGRLSFGAGHPYARPSYGTPDSVDHLGMEDLLERQSSLLVPNGSTLLVAGDVTPDAVMRAVERTFGSWARGARAPKTTLRAPPVKKRRTVTFIPQKPSKTLRVCATRPLSDVRDSPEMLEVLAAIVDRRLTNALREERGYTYHVSGGLLRLNHAKALLFCTRLDAAQAAPAARLFLETLAGLSTAPPDATEVDLAREQLVASTDASADELTGVLELWDRAITLDEPVSLAARDAALRGVGAEPLGALAKKVMRLEQYQLVMVGERATVAPVAKALQLGALRTPHLSRTPSE